MVKRDLGRGIDFTFAVPGERRICEVGRSHFAGNRVRLTDSYGRAAYKGRTAIPASDLAVLDLDRNIGSPELADWLSFGWENDG